MLLKMLSPLYESTLAVEINALKLSMPGAGRCLDCCPLKG